MWFESNSIRPTVHHHTHPHTHTGRPSCHMTRPLYFVLCICFPVRRVLRYGYHQKTRFLLHGVHRHHQQCTRHCCTYHMTHMYRVQTRIISSVLHSPPGSLTLPPSQPAINHKGGRMVRSGQHVSTVTAEASDREMIVREKNKTYSTNIVHT